MQCLVVAVKYVDYSKPPVLAFLPKPEELATIGGIRTRPDFLDSLERN